MELRTDPGLERSCAPARAGRIVARPLAPGVECIDARFFGNAFSPHRHDTYAVGMTLGGVQAFRYRGVRRASLPGNVIVLHPDEEHDGGAGSDDGLHYRMLYLDAAVLREALGDQARGLPFVSEPVLPAPALRRVVADAVALMDDRPDELRLDDALARLAQQMARHAGLRLHAPGTVAVRAGHRARDYLLAHADRTVRSAELERVTGLDRFELSRHFRALFATSPHRFLLMRRLERARRLIAEGGRLADVAAATGFADQSHLNRHFRKAFGMPPGRWAALAGGRGGPGPVAGPG